MTPRNQRAAWRVLEQLAEPRAVIAVGDCPINGSVFRAGQDAALAGETFPIDVELPGCPPSPTLILEAIEAAVNLLDGEGETAAAAEEPEAADEAEGTEEEPPDTESDADEEAADEEREERADTGNRREKP